VYTGNRIEGSNPSLSANLIVTHIKQRHPSAYPKKYRHCPELRQPLAN